MFKNYDEMLAEAKKYAPMKVAVAGAQEDTVLLALNSAQEGGLIEPILFGDKKEIERLAAQTGYSLDNISVTDVSDPDLCALEAVKCVSSGNADILMKGLLQTGTIMKAVFNKEMGLRTNKLISHLFMIKLPDYPKFLSLTDGGINVAPELPDQLKILENAIDFYHLMGFELPKIAVLAPVETVSDKIPSTMNAAILAKMNDRGQIPGALIDGPLAFDNAISPESVREKKIVSKVAGDADVLFVNDIDMGNGLFKGLIYFGHGVPAAVMLGTKRPVIVTSRADSAECKFLSIALNVLYAGKLKEREK